MKLLALETSTDACSCAVWLSGAVYERFEVAPRQHGALLLAMVESLLLEAALRLGQLDGLAFGCGPGTFTGLRIAAGVVQGLAFSAQLPVVRVSSLAALAQGTPPPGGLAAEQILVTQDARMNEVYHGAFLRGPDFMVKEITVARVCRPEQIVIPTTENPAWIALGSAWQAHSAALTQVLAGYNTTVLKEVCYPHAGDVARLGVKELSAGRAVSAEYALPVYLRDDVAGKRVVSVGER